MRSRNCDARDNSWRAPLARECVLRSALFASSRVGYTTPDVRQRVVARVRRNLPCLTPTTRLPDYPLSDERLGFWQRPHCVLSVGVWRLPFALLFACAHAPIALQYLPTLRTALICEDIWTRAVGLLELPPTLLGVAYWLRGPADCMEYSSTP